MSTPYQPWEPPPETIRLCRAMWDTSTVGDRMLLVTQAGRHALREVSRAELDWTDAGTTWDTLPESYQLSVACYVHQVARAIANGYQALRIEQERASELAERDRDQADAKRRQWQGRAAA